MDWLIWTGAFVSLIGLAGIIWCILMVARARKANGRDQSLIVAEGYMDVIAMAAGGIENAVAPLGTALTENQMGLAWRVGGEPVLCFDGDQAGLNAAFRSVDTA